MNGLEAILNRILSDAEDRIRDINEQTDNRCAELMTSADQEAERMIREARLKAEEQAANLIRRSESLSALEARKRILASRQGLIDDVIEQAGARLTNLTADEKTILYDRFLIEYAMGDEIVVFSRSDALIADQVIAAANREKGWKLTTDPTPGDFAGGLILRKNLVETNLTIELLIRSCRPELVSLAAKALFSE